MGYFDAHRVIYRTHAFPTADDQRSLVILGFLTEGGYFLELTVPSEAWHRFKLAKAHWDTIHIACRVFDFHLLLQSGGGSERHSPSSTPPLKPYKWPVLGRYCLMDVNTGP